jgi:transcriptional regulator with XRE-family HTH domain
MDDPKSCGQRYALGGDLSHHDGMAHLGDRIAANVRGERARRRWTQGVLAERLGWSRATVSDLEAGRRKVAADDLALCAPRSGSGSPISSGYRAEDVERLRL